MCVNIIFAFVNNMPFCARNLLVFHRFIFCTFAQCFSAWMSYPLWHTSDRSFDGLGEHRSLLFGAHWHAYAGTLLTLIKRACLGTSFRWEAFRLLSNSSTQAWNKVSKVLDHQKNLFFFEEGFIFMLILVAGKDAFLRKQASNLLNDVLINLVWSMHLSGRLHINNLKGI